MNQHDLKSIKSRNNIVDVAASLGFIVSRGNRTNCLFPENHQHADTHPSLILDTRKNRFWCPVCPSTRGDVIEFVKLARKCSFGEAIAFLSGHSGACSPKLEERGAIAPALHLDAPKTMPSEFDDINQYFFESLSEPTEQANGWLESRGISKNTALDMQVRCLLKRRHIEEKLQAQFPLERLISSGLLDENGTLPFDRHRLIWTFFQADKPVYFQGRALDATVRPKEMCIKQIIPCPYNIDVLKKPQSTITICEGVIDTLTLICHGFPAVGVVGVNGFKRVWLAQFRGLKVKVAFDSDRAGHVASNELVQQFRSSGIDAEKVYLPDGCDVNRFFLAYSQFCA